MARGLGPLLGLRQVVMSGNIVGQEGAEALVAEAGRLGERQAAAGAAQRCVMVLGEAAVSAENTAAGKGYVSLVYDTTPNYIDTHAFPTTAAVWTYRAIFHSGEVQVGVWSNPVSIAVVA